MIEQDHQLADGLQDPEERKSSKLILQAIEEAQNAFRQYLDRCKIIDDIYSRLATTTVPIGFQDQDFDLFWASMEILKPAIYSRTPVPVASPMFDDRDIVVSTTADLLERCLSSSFKRSDINQVMLGIRDDLAISNRGVMWVRYDSQDGQKVCYEDLDRTDFVHDPARKWADVGWVARRGWMTLDQMANRFKRTPLATLQAASFPTRREDRDNGASDNSKKAGVWEVWSRTDRKVYWVVEGVDIVLDERDPYLDLSGFFPCPRPAYGTTRRRSLVPIPDFERYQAILEQVNDLTVRIYELLDEVRLRGFYTGSSDRGAAIQKLFDGNGDAMKLIAIDAGLMQGAGGDPIQWLPLDMIVTTIQGLIAARGQLFEDFYQLSGISDIMRGSTEATETLGAQRLKQQNGSVRVQDKQHELERLAADTAGIAAEIMAENFSKETLLEMAQMKIRSKAEITRDLKDAEKAAKAELEALAAQAEEAVQSGQVQDPAQAEQQFNEAQQQIIAKYEPAIQKLSREVSIEDVMKLLRDSKSRNFVIEIETDSTILQDEVAAKQSANEFYAAFTGGIQGLAGAAAMGPEAVKMATEVFKMVIAPYRPSRAVMSAIDDFVDAAPQIAERMNAQQAEGGEDQQAMAQLAQAELMKAQAQGMNYQAQAELKAAELQAKTQEGAMKLQQDQQRFSLEVESTKGELAKTKAEIDKIRAEIAKMGVDVQFQAQKEQREDVKTAADIQTRQQDQAMRVAGMQQDAQFRVQDGQRADRQLTAAERAAQMKGQSNGEA